MKHCSFLFAAAALGCYGAAEAAELSVLGGWRQVVASHQVAAGAPVSPRLASMTGAATLTISRTRGAAWRVYARCAGSGRWDPRLQLSVRASGRDFVPVGDTDTEILSGTGDRRSVPLQLQLTGLSSQLRPAEYGGGIIYTIVP